MIMDSMSNSSVTEQARENSVNKNFLLPRKLARQSNPIIKYRKPRRGSAGRIPEQQNEYLTHKELMRTIAYLRTAIYYEHDKLLPNNKACIIEEEDEEEWSTQSDQEKGQKKLEKSIQKPNNNDFTYTLTKNQRKKRSYIDNTNKEYASSSSSSHVINIKSTCKTSQRGGLGLTENDSHVRASMCKAFIQFCSTEIICPQEHRAALAVKLYGVQVALLSGLGNPFQNISQSITSSTNISKTPMLSLWQASSEFLPAMVWSVMFIMSFVYTIVVVWSMAFRVPIITMLCIALLYSLAMLVGAASGFDVACGTFRLSGILFACLGVLGFALILLILLFLVLFASWRCTKQDGGTKAKPTPSHCHTGQATTTHRARATTTAQKQAASSDHHHERSREDTTPHTTQGERRRFPQRRPPPRTGSVNSVVAQIDINDYGWARKVQRERNR